ncbi:MAG: DUF3971 domain-containing protein [Rhodospirillaceae bacterium]
MITYTARRFLHALGYLLAGFVVLIGLASWRLASGPVELTVLTPFLVQALDEAAAEWSLHTQVGGTVVTFGGFDNPLDLRLHDVQLAAADGRPVATVPELGVGISLRALLRGHPLLDRLSVIRPTLHLERTTDGRLVLDLNGPGASLPPSPVVMTPEPGDGQTLVTRILDSLRMPPDPMSAVGAFNQVSVVGAVLTLEDRIAGVTWLVPRADLTASRTTGGADAQARIELELNGRTAVIEAGATERRGDGYRPGAAGATVKVRNLDLGALALVVPRLASLAGTKLPVSGSLEASLDGDFLPVQLRLKVNGTGPGRLALPALRPEPVQVAALSLDAILEPGNGKITLNNSRLELSDPALTLIATGQGTNILTTPAATLRLALKRGSRTGSIDARLEPAAAPIAAVGSILTLRLADIEPALFAGFGPALQPLAAAAVPVAGTVTIALDAGARPVRVGLDLAAGPGKLVAPAALQLPEPLPVHSIKLRAELRQPLAPVPELIDLKTLVVDFDGFGIDASGTVARIGARTGDQLLIKSLIKAHDVRADSLSRLWPPNISKTAHDWVVQNITAGMIDQASLTIDGSTPVADPWAIKAASLNGKIEASNLTINYFKTLAPITGIAGRGIFRAGSELILNTSGGHILDLTVGDAEVVISKLDTPQEWIDIKAQLSGSLRSTLTVLNTPPLLYAHKVDINPQLAEGNQLGRLHFVFPLRRDLELDDVGIFADADLHGAAVQGIAGGLNADQGELKLVLDRNGMDVTGRVRLEGMPSTVYWRENFTDDADPGTRVSIKGKIGEALLADHGLHLAPFFNGTFDTDLDLAIDRHKRIALAANLNLTGARVSLPVLDLIKPMDKPGTARFAVEFDKGRPVRLSHFVAEAPGMKAAGTADLNPVSHAIERLTLTEFRAGASDAKVEIKRRSDGGWGIDVRGASLDASPLFDTPETAEGMSKLRQERLTRREHPAPPGPPYNLTLQLGRLIIGSGNRALTNVVGKLENNGLGWDTLDLKAELKPSVAPTGAGGGGGTGVPLTVSYLPDGSQRRLALACEDAGALLRAFDVTETMLGGSLRLTGLGAPGIPRQPLALQLEMGEARVVGAPLLARILNALSVTGLLELLRGEGLTFSQAAGDIIWGEDMLTINNLRTSGGALGLTMGGRVDLATGSLAIEGTIVPVYTLNRILGLIPILGDLLSGGAGQGIFAATYSLSGSTDEPVISVNPLAALAPGFLRNLFFMK